MIFSESRLTVDRNNIPDANLYLIDLTAQQSSFNSETVPTNDRMFPTFEGNSAEWIMERPTVHDTWGSQVLSLPHYNAASV